MDHGMDMVSNNSTNSKTVTGYYQRVLLGIIFDIKGYFWSCPIFGLFNKVLYLVWI